MPTKTCTLLGNLRGERLTYSILDTITPPPQAVVLEVEKLESGVDVLDEFADLEGTGEVALSDGVGG